MTTTRQARSLKDTQEMAAVSPRCVSPRAVVAKPSYTDRYGVGPDAVTGIYPAIKSEKE